MSKRKFESEKSNNDEQATTSIEQSQPPQRLCVSPSSSRQSHDDNEDTKVGIVLLSGDETIRSDDTSNNNNNTTTTTYVDPVRVAARKEKVRRAKDQITQVVHVFPSDKEKLTWLLEILPKLTDDDGNALIFASKRTTVQTIESELSLKGFEVVALHGDQGRASRMAILEKFNFGIYNILVATDVAVRRLNIKSIKSVVNFDIARDTDLHALRLGIGSTNGTAYTLITHGEAQFASELLNILNAAGQNVSPELSELVDSWNAATKKEYVEQSELVDVPVEQSELVNLPVNLSELANMSIEPGELVSSLDAAGQIVPVERMDFATKVTDHASVGAVTDVHGAVGEPEQQQSVSENVDFSEHFITNEIFDTREDLMSWCRDVALRLSFVLVTQKSENTTPKRLGRVHFGCERGGEYRRKRKCKDISGKTPTRRSRASIKCGCPFLLKGRALPDLRWKLIVECGVHNHEILPVRRLQPDEVQLAEQMSAAGIAPRHILSTLKIKNEKNYSTSKTIYNARSKFGHRELCRRTVIKHTLKMVNEHGYMHFVESCRRRNVVTQIFWCNPDSVKLFKAFPDVLIVDCTNKTNRYKMPLLEMVGVTSTGHTFDVGFVFMENENESNYIWAFERLKTVIDSEWTPKVVVTDKENILINAINKAFPNASRLLCRWHVNKDITANCKKDFEKQEDWLTFIQEWEDLVDVQSDETFASKLTEFETTWHAHPSSISYIRTNWLPHKEYFVVAWTKRVMHLGCTTTQRVESEHRTFNEYMKSSACSYPTVWKSMDTMVKLQLVDIESAFQQSVLWPKFTHTQDPAYAEIGGYISLYALDIIENEKTRGLSSLGFDHSACGCLKRVTHGLPCAHEILEYSCSGKPIPLSCIHQHWKQLSRTLPESLSTDLDFNRDIAEPLAKKWATSTEEDRRVIERKIEEMINEWELHQPPHAAHNSILVLEPKMED